MADWLDFSPIIISDGKSDGIEILQLRDPGMDLNGLPLIKIDIPNNTMTIEGSIISEYTGKQFEIIFKHLFRFKSATHFTLVCNISYLNTAASRCLTDVFEVMKTYKGDVKVLWRFYMDDSEMEIVGEEFAELVDIPFDFIYY